MNKRAKNRLVGISAIVILAVIALFFLLTETSVEVPLAEVLDPDLIGERVQVTGMVVAGSWDRKTNPMRFEIKDPDDADGTGPVLTVVYTGPMVPSTFGDGVEAIIKGVMEPDGVIKSNDMITKCPSKYETATDAYTVAQLKDRADEMVDIPVRVVGYVKDGKVNTTGSAVRFILVDAQGAPVELNIAFDGALPDAAETTDTRMVLTGEMNANGSFDAVSVAIEEN